jgi:hypothetical protein
MQPKQEGQILQMKKSKNDFLEKRVATGSPPPGGKILLPGGAGGRAKKFTSKFNFDKIKKKYDATGKLDLQDFDNAEDIGMFIDWYNKGVKDSKEAEATREIIEISKFLARIQGRKTFIIDGK